MATCTYQGSIARPGQYWAALALMLMMAGVQAATPPKADVQVTGTALVRDMLADPKDDALNNIKRERAMGYIDGVMDAGLGRQWCPAGKRVSHEMNYLVTEEISRLPKAELDRNAAALVSTALARLFPCKLGVAP